MKPRSQLMARANGLLSAALLSLLCAQSAWAAPGYRVLRGFNRADGEGPWGGVTLDQKGALLGTGASGGSGGGCQPYGCGTVYELAPGAKGRWSDLVLYDFPSCSYGCAPYGRPIIASSGSILGTTTGGPHYPGGAVFELTEGFAGWTETLLHAFCPTLQCIDGAVPFAGVISDSAGNLYGTTAGGGPHGGGVVFELTPGPSGWKETVIHGFYPSNYNQPAPGGTGPYAGLIMDGSGNLYGTTWRGGLGYGVAFELASVPGGGWKELVLHKFGSFPNDGRLPGWRALFMDASGNLYGTTSQGGRNICYAGCGTIFQLVKDGDGGWRENVLYNFKSDSRGSGPNAGIVMDALGNLYGTSDYGGYGDCGVIYKLAPQPKGKWSYTVLHTFGYGSDGCLPEGNLAIDNNGNLYGGTVLGGAHGQGVVFELTP